MGGFDNGSSTKAAFASRVQSFNFSDPDRRSRPCGRTKRWLERPGARLRAVVCIRVVSASRGRIKVTSIGGKGGLEMEKFQLDINQFSRAWWKLVGFAPISAARAGKGQTGRGWVQL